MAWCFAEEATQLTEALLNRLATLTDTAIVPALWLYEVVNVLELAARRGRFTKEKALAFIESLADLPIEIENPTRAQVFVAVRALVDQYNLTAYDAAYLELALRHQLPLAALDHALTKAADAAGVPTVTL
jgi:predicted nucleic acid-binding protein